MISKKPESVLIITHDLKLKRTFTSRYFSFIIALRGSGHKVKGVGVDFAFNPHPINDLDKFKNISDLEEDIVTIKHRKLNSIQKLLVFADRLNLPFFLKKILLAWHIVVYKTDQWRVDMADFEELNVYKPTIVISGGAMGVMVSAYQLAKKHKAKFIIDYRDPLNFGYPLLETNQTATAFKRRFTLKKELEMLTVADQIITVSDSLRSFFPKQFIHKVSVIENGSNFEQQEINYSAASPALFHIVYLGTLYNVQLEEECIFQAFSKFLKLNGNGLKKFKVSFLGSSQNKKLPAIIDKYNLTPFVEITNRLQKNELKEVLENASMFLHLKYGIRQKIITSKQADYLMFRKPILLPNSDHGDIAESILENNVGYVCNGEIDAIVNVLQLEYDKHLKGESVILEERDLRYLSRTKIAEKLLEII